MIIIWYHTLILVLIIVTFAEEIIRKIVKVKRFFGSRKVNVVTSSVKKNRRKLAQAI